MENAHIVYQLIQKIKSDYAKSLPGSIQTQLVTITNTLEDHLGITTANTANATRKAKEQSAIKPFKQLYNYFVT